MGVLACLRFVVIPYTAKMTNNGGCKFVKIVKKKKGNTNWNTKFPHMPFYSPDMALYEKMITNL